MAHLKPLKLHQLIGTSTVWTDALWDEALIYLLEWANTFDALAMAQVLHGTYPRNYPHKIDFLRDFRAYPPTVLLGAFDLTRARLNAQKNRNRSRPMFG